MTKPARADNFFCPCFTRREKGVCDPELRNNFRELMSQFFFQPIIIQLLFSWSYHMWGLLGDLFCNGRQFFKLEGVLYEVDPKYVVSMGFLGGKERIRIPINSKHSSREALKHHIIEYTGSKSESEKRGLIRSSIEIKLCRLEKSAE